ncbi:MAG: class I SAM-dependent methyltransferase, partial [Bacteroidota bacterium]
MPSMITTGTVDHHEQKSRVRSHFDQSESWKGKVYLDHSDQFNRAMVRRKLYSFAMLNNHLHLKKGKALDVGCGGGEYVAELMKVGLEAYGVDLSDEMILMCQRRLNLDGASFQARFKQGDIEQIPFDDEDFDLVLCVGVLGYLLEDSRAVREVHRVLKPGGCFLVSVQNMMSLANIDYVLRRNVGSLFRSESRAVDEMSPRGLTMTCPWIFRHAHVPHHYRLYNPWKFERLLESGGFRRIDARTTGYEFRLFRRFKLFPERVLTAMELVCERLFY